MFELQPSHEIKIQQEGDQRQVVASTPVDLLELARGLARRIASSNGGTCHSGLVGAELDKYGIHLGNWMGSLFRSPEWTPTGRVVQNTRSSSKRRLVRVWKLRGGIV